MQGGACRVVPDGVRPEELGIDTRSELEVPRLPVGAERWVGPSRGWVESKTAAAAAARHHARDPERLLETVAALAARVETLEAKMAAMDGNQPSGSAGP